VKERSFCRGFFFFDTMSMFESNHSLLIDPEHITRFIVLLRYTIREERSVYFVVANDVRLVPENKQDIIYQYFRHRAYDTKMTAQAFPLQELISYIQCQSGVACLRLSEGREAKES